MRFFMFCLEFLLNPHAVLEFENDALITIYRCVINQVEPQTVAEFYAQVWQAEYLKREGFDNIALMQAAELLFLQLFIFRRCLLKAGGVVIVFSRVFLLIHRGGGVLLNQLLYHFCQ